MNSNVTSNKDRTISTSRRATICIWWVGHKHRPHYHLERASKLFSCSYQLTGTRSGYFLRIFSPSDLRFSNACSSLYCHFIFAWKFSFKITNFRYLRPSFHFCDRSVKDATNCACPKQMKTLESHDLTSSFAMASERFRKNRHNLGQNMMKILGTGTSSHKIALLGSLITCVSPPPPFQCCLNQMPFESTISILNIE